MLDTVSELLSGMRLKGASYSRVRLAPPFGVAFPASTQARFHFVAAGKLQLRAPDGGLIELGCGDAVLLPRGDEHALVSAPGVIVRELETYQSVPICSDICAIDYCPDGTCRTKDATVFTGRMEFELDTLHPLVGLMPPVMLVTAFIGSQPEIEPLLKAMEREIAEERAGSAGILARLADVVAASVVRAWVESGCGSASGWLEALRDPRLGKVIAAIHRNPGREWTVAEMADEMSISRSVFAKRFAEVTGSTPQRYLLMLRMRLAEQWFRQDRLGVDAAARRLGFASQAAFARAYKRATGQSPGQARGRLSAANTSNRSLNSNNPAA